MKLVLSQITAKALGAPERPLKQHKPKRKGSFKKPLKNHNILLTCVVSASCLGKKEPAVAKRGLNQDVRVGSFISFLFILISYTLNPLASSDLSLFANSLSAGHWRGH